MKAGAHALARAAMVASALAALTGCGGTSVTQEQARQAEDGTRPRTLDTLSDEAKAALGNLRVYFGHQSVGANIVNGVATLGREHPVLALRVLNDGETAATPGGFFSHGPVGQNGDPAGKTDDFARRLEGGLHALVDVAFHKYCYVDIGARTDVEAVFARYRDTMARLKAAYPSVTFVHVTAPLTDVQAGPKAAVKRLIGRAPGGYLDNIRREQFNELMRREYAGREPLFDLAAIEATSPDGRPETFAFDGMAGRALFPSYGSDGRHLNDLGQRRVAEELLVMLARLPVAPAVEGEVLP